jgi:hypothetical protein
MTTNDGGIVREVLRAPRDVSALDGLWTGGLWSPQHRLTIGVYRSGKLLKRVLVRGVDHPRGRRAPLLLLHRFDAQWIVPGDVVTFGSSTATEYAVQADFENVSLPIVTHLQGDPEHRCIFEQTPLGLRMVIFHDVADVPRTSFHQATMMAGGRPINVLLRPFYQGRARATEILLNGSDVSLKRLVNAVTPLRNFTLGTGQEMLEGVAKGRAKFKKEILDVFEPRVAALSGSVRLALQEGEPTQRRLYDVKPSEPFQLLAALAEAIIKQDEQRLFEELNWHRVFSVARFLAQVKMLASQHVEVRTDEGERLILGDDAVRWLNEVLRQPLRKITSVGDLYAADFRRKWCRILVATEATEQWTLYFDQPRSPFVHGLMNQPVRVRFETRSPTYVRTGTGRLLSIRAADDPGPDSEPELESPSPELDDESPE